MTTTMHSQSGMMVTVEATQLKKVRVSVKPTPRATFYMFDLTPEDARVLAAALLAYAAVPR